MRRDELEFIRYEDIGGDETETSYKCPKCKKVIITYWKDNTIGFKMSMWYKCSVCGFDMESQE